MCVAAFETSGLDAARQRKGRNVDLVQFRLRADDGIANAKQEVTDAGIGRRDDLFERKEAFLQCVHLRALPTQGHHLVSLPIDRAYQSPAGVSHNAMFYAFSTIGPSSYDLGIKGLRNFWRTAIDPSMGASWNVAPFA